MRNLDIGALRSLVAIADTRTVTQAAQQNHLTQSAVSMQVKRLEQTFNTKLLHREGRGVVLTSTGQQLVAYARRLLALNDETWSRLTNDDYEGEISLGVPIDLIYPHIPAILAQATVRYPRIKLNLVSSLTKPLKQQLARGEIDLILTTEDDMTNESETLVRLPQVWMGAKNGQAYLQRPLPLALCNVCSQREEALGALDRDDVTWEMVTNTNSDATINAMVSADLAVTPQLYTALEPNCIAIPDGYLPALSDVFVNLYRSHTGDVRLIEKMAEIVCEVYTNTSTGHALSVEEPRFASNQF